MERCVKREWARTWILAKSFSTLFLRGTGLGPIHLRDLGIRLWDAPYPPDSISQILRWDRGLVYLPSFPPPRPRSSASPTAIPSWTVSSATQASSDTFSSLLRSLKMDLRWNVCGKELQ